MSNEDYLVWSVLIFLWSFSFAAIAAWVESENTLKIFLSILFLDLVWMAFLLSSMLLEYFQVWPYLPQ